jgi:transposase
MPRKFDEEFRQEAVKLVREGGVPVLRAAEELGIGVSTLNKWVGAASGSHSSGNELLESEREELKRLRKENLQLKVERDILKKATAYFARSTL